MRVLVALALMQFSSCLAGEEEAGAGAGHASGHRQSYGEASPEWRGAHLEAADGICRRQRAEGSGGFRYFSEGHFPDLRGLSGPLSAVDDGGR
jgi:hypothetical protein